MIIEKKTTGAEEVFPAEERIVEGLLAPSLKEGYLRGYVMYTEELPGAIEELLKPLCVQDENAKNGNRVELISSAARYTIHGMNQRHWGVKNFFQEELQKQAENPVVQQLFGGPHGLSADADLDIVVGYTVAEASQRLRERFGVTDAPKEVHIGDAVRQEYEFRLGKNFRIHVSTGPIPSVPEIKTAVVSLFDNITGGRVSHLDIGEIPNIGSVIEREKRLGGKTSQKQDTGKMELFLRNGNVAYRIKQEAVLALGKQDRLTTESQNPEEVMEIFLRALRMNMFHEFSTITMQDESKIPAVDLKNVLRWFDSKTLFFVRQLATESILEGRDLFGPNIPLLQRELALCLTIDPYVTIQTIRDTNLGLLIPGFREMSREDWNTILQSRWFVVRAVPTQKENRTWEFMEEERRFYLSGDEDVSLPPQFNGVERLMRALQDMKLLTRDMENPWQAYKKFWEPREKLEKIEPDNFSKDLTARASGTLLGQALHRMNYEELSGSTALSEVGARIESFTTLLYLLARIPPGLTPRELQYHYRHIAKPWVRDQLPNIKEPLLDIKLLGVVNVERPDRIRQDLQSSEKVAFYTLQRGFEPTNLKKFFDPGFQTVLRESPEYIVYSDEEFKPMMEHIERNIDTFGSRGIHTMEALVSLSGKDWEVIEERYAKKSLTAMDLYNDDRWKEIRKQVVTAYEAYETGLTKR